MLQHAKWKLVLALCCISVTQACGSPCKDLAKKICSCRSSSTEEQSCNQRVDSEASSKNFSTADEEKCADLLDTCRCSKLKQGDLAACGLSQESQE